MKISSLKITAIIISITMIFSLVSCNKNGESDNSSSSGTKNRPLMKTSSNIEIPKIELKNKTVTVLGIDQPQFHDEQNRTQDLGEGIVFDFFKKYYGGTIKMDIVSPADVVTTLATRVLSGDAPDVVGGHSGFPSLVIQDNIIPTDGILNYNLPIMKKLTEVYNQYKFKDKHYFLPWIVDLNSYVFYNKSMFEDNEMPTPRDLYTQGKWNWDTFRDAAKQLTLDTNRDGTPDRWGVEMCTWHDTRLAFSTNSNIIKIDKAGILSSNLNDANIERALNFLADLTLKDKVADPNRDANSVATMLDTGKAAMCLAPDFYSGNLFNELKKAKKLGWAPVPKDPKADKYYASGQTIGFFLPKGVKNIDGAEALMYSCIVGMEEYHMKGSESYNAALNKFLKKYPNYTKAEYEDLFDISFKYNKEVTFVIDAYREILDIDTIYTQMLGTAGAAPQTYQQVIQQVEPGMKQIIDGLNAS